jgi:hypothetical protein
VEEQGQSAIAPPQGPVPSGGGPAPQEATDAFRRRRLLLHRRSLAPPLSRFPQGFLAFYFRFLSQRRFGFYFCFLFLKVTSWLLSFCSDLLAAVYLYLWIYVFMFKDREI